MCEKLCERCGEPVRRFKDEYDIFERMHWVCFHYTYEHGDYDIDEPCDDPSCPCNINKGWNNDSYHTTDKSINIVSIDKKNIISMTLIEEDIMGFGFDFDVSIKDVDYGWLNSRVWVEKEIIKNFIDNLSVLDIERKGKASIEAMSPNEFELDISNYDSSGHIKVRYLIGKSRPSVGHRDRLTSIIQGEFELYPNNLVLLQNQFSEIII